MDVRHVNGNRIDVDADDVHVLLIVNPLVVDVCVLPRGLRRPFRIFYPFVIPFHVDEDVSIGGADIFPSFKPVAFLDFSSDGFFCVSSYGFKEWELYVLCW